MCVVFSISLILQTFGLFFCAHFCSSTLQFSISVCFYSSDRKGLACYLSFPENVRRAVWFFSGTFSVCLILPAWTISVRAIYLVLDNQLACLSLGERFFQLSPFLSSLWSFFQDWNPMRLSPSRIRISIGVVLVQVLQAPTLLGHHG